MTGERGWVALLLVALGGALGAVARFGVSLMLVAPIGATAAFPWATLSVNALGAFCIGVAASLTAVTGRWPLNPAARQGVMAGFFGGFTTFSIFSLEALTLVNAGHIGTAVTYIAASIAIWLGAVYAGFRLGQA